MISLTYMASMLYVFPVPALASIIWRPLPGSSKTDFHDLYMIFLQMFYHLAHPVCKGAGKQLLAPGGSTAEDQLHFLLIALPSPAPLSLKGLSRLYKLSSLSCHQPGRYCVGHPEPGGILPVMVEGDQLCKQLLRLLRLLKGEERHFRITKIGQNKTTFPLDRKIGRASCRERVERTGGAGGLERSRRG